MMHPMITVRNEQVFAQDDEGDTLFIIVRGTVNVLMKKRHISNYMQNDKVKFMKITLKKIELALQNQKNSVLEKKKFDKQIKQSLTKCLSMINNKNGPRISVKLKTLYDNLEKDKQFSSINRAELAKKLGIDDDPNALDVDDYYNILQEIHPSPSKAKSNEQMVNNPMSAMGTSDIQKTMLQNLKEYFSNI